MKRIKKYFITGLIILLPVALTLAVVLFLFNLLTEPFVGIVKTVLRHYDLLDQGFLFFSADQLQKYISQLIILLLLFFFTIGLGFLTRWFFFHYLIRFWDRLLQKIPFIRSVYKTCQDVILTIFKTDSNSFKQVVLIPFPSESLQSIALVTKDRITSPLDSKENLIVVFVPTAPNPTSGFLMLVKEKDIVYLDTKVEDALKYVISCGVISPKFPAEEKVKNEKAKES